MSVSPGPGRALALGSPPRGVLAGAGRRRILASDIDGTLLRDGGPTPGLDSLRRLLRRTVLDIRLIYATGRTLSQTMALVDSGVLPRPDAVAAMVGTEIWFPPWKAPNAAYRGWLEVGWHRAAVAQVATSLPGVTPQPNRFQSRYKASYYCDDPGVARRLRRLLRRRGLSARVVWSSARHLDLLPARAGKREAVEYCRRRWGVPPACVLVAGDSGNDLGILVEPRYLGVAVGNAAVELHHVGAADGVHRAVQPYAAGVLEGALAFGFFETAASMSERTAPRRRPGRGFTG